MTSLHLLLLIIVFFVTSIVSVVTGSTSLITVPVMLQVGIEPRTALATNMFALTCLSLGGTLPFLQQGKIDRKRLPALIVLTIAGSLLGAFWVLVVPSQFISQIVSISMFTVIIFVIARQNIGVIPQQGLPSCREEIAAYIETFLLGIYGGFFSGGYVTLLTAAYVMFFHMTFVEAIAITKLINVFSSLIATVVFMARGIVNYPLGVLLGSVMFVGAIVGARVALQLNNVWLRRIFLTTVILLAIKTILI